MTDTPKTVFVTKYALTRGIEEFAVVRFKDDMVIVQCEGGPGGESWFFAPHWHLTREAAVTRANQMRDTKLASLHQQAERVKGLRF